MDEWFFLYQKVNDKSRRLGSYRVMHLYIEFLVTYSMWRGFSLTVRREGTSVYQVKLCRSLEWILDPPTLTRDTIIGTSSMSFFYRKVLQ